MIRFCFNPQPADTHAFEHFAIEGDNVRGYLLLGWNRVTPESGPDARMSFQLWFETLAEAMAYSNNEFGIVREWWQAPHVQPPAAAFDPTRKRRNPREDGAD